MYLTVWQRRQIALEGRKRKAGRGLAPDFSRHSGRCDTATIATSPAGSSGVSQLSQVATESFAVPNNLPYLNTMAAPDNSALRQAPDPAMLFE